MLEKPFDIFEGLGGSKSSRCTGHGAEQIRFRRLVKVRMEGSPQKCRRPIRRVEASMQRKGRPILRVEASTQQKGRPIRRVEASMQRKGRPIRRVEASTQQKGRPIRRVEASIAGHGGHSPGPRLAPSAGREYRRRSPIHDQRQSEISRAYAGF